MLLMVLLDELDKKNLHCMGCGVCKVICRVHAISMKPDENGFMQPEMDETKCKECIMCEVVCPQLHARQDNSSEPDCYAIRTKQEVELESSLESIFRVFAEYVLSKGGYVCSPCFDEDFHRVSYRLVSDVKDLGRLPAVPWVYCNPGDIYIQARRIMDQGKLVLFYGVPCQVAALRNFLDWDDENLITMDSFCDGAVSGRIYSAYLDEVAGRREIRNISYFTIADGAKIEFKDGTEYFAIPGKDPYFRAIQENLGISEGCHFCRFTEEIRQGDISIGTFLDRNVYTDEMEQEMSCLMLNSDKSKKLLCEKGIAKKIFLGKKIPVGFLREHEHLKAHTTKDLRQSRFFSLLGERKSFRCAVGETIAKRFDVALVGCWSMRDYGTELSYYALYHVLKDMGCTTILLEQRKNREEKGGINEEEFTHLFRELPYPCYDVFPIYGDMAFQTSLNGTVATFLTGPGRIWDCNRMKESSYQSYALDFVSDYRRRVSYASSLGGSYFPGAKEETAYLTAMKKMDAISIGQKTDADFLKKKCDIKAELVLDPVLLCHRRYFTELLEKSKVYTGGSYVFSYFLQPDENSYEIDELAKKMNCRWVSMVAADLVPENWPYEYERNCSVEDWLKYIAGSKLVVTDSFHAICLSILYGKPFFFLAGWRGEGQDTEMTNSLLSSLGLEDRIIVAVEDLLEEDSFSCKMDYSNAKMILKDEKKHCIQWLRKALMND